MRLRVASIPLSARSRRVSAVWASNWRSRKSRWCVHQTAEGCGAHYYPGRGADPTIVVSEVSRYTLGKEGGDV